MYDAGKMKTVQPAKQGKISFKAESA